MPVVLANSHCARSTGAENGCDEGWGGRRLSWKEKGGLLVETGRRLKSWSDGEEGEVGEISQWACFVISEF